MNLAERIRSLPSSPTLGMAAKVKTLRAKGVSVIDFGLGEPDFETPDNVKLAGISAIASGFTRYTAAGGIRELKHAIANRFCFDKGLRYSADQIVVGSGAKHVLYSVFMALCNPGDEIILPSPYWVSYPDQIKLAGGVPVVLPRKRSDDYQISVRDLEKCTSGKTRGIVLNTPCNPTGAVYTQATLENIAAWAKQGDFFMVFDEIYDKFVYRPVEHVNVATLSADAKERTIVVNGVSKTYAMTGWRIGYAAGPENVMAGVEKLISQTTSNANSIAQKASMEALCGGQQSVVDMTRVFEARRECAWNALSTVEGFDCRRPAGAFYFFPDVSAWYGREFCGRKITDSTAFAELLLDEANVAVLPGCVFGDDNAIRLSYVTSGENIQAGFARIKRLLC